MKRCCICEKEADHIDFKIKLPRKGATVKYICAGCKQLLLVGFETQGKMKFAKGRLAKLKDKES